MVAVLNAILYWLTLAVYKTKHKHLDVYTVLLVIYAITATLCAITVHQQPLAYSNVSFLGLLFIYTIFMIMVSVFNGFYPDNNNVRIVDSWIIRVIIYLYIFCAFYVIFTSFEDVFFRIQENAWNSIRNEVYADEAGITLYSSPYQRIAKNICSYCSPLAVLYVFYLLTRETPRYIIIALLLLSIVVPSFMAATVVASRSMIMGIVLKLGFGYLLFHNTIPHKRKKYIYIISGIVLLFLAIYVLAVSISRFGEDDYQSSMFYYFGHSMISFAQNMFGKLHDYLYGEYFFYWFVNDTYLTSIDLSSLGSKHGTSFITFVGPLYADFGVIGTFIFAFLSFFIFRSFTRKRLYGLPELIMLFHYMSYLGAGIFCPGTSGALSFLMVVVLCGIVKLGEIKHRKI